MVGGARRGACVAARSQPITSRLVSDCHTPDNAGIVSIASTVGSTNTAVRGINLVVETIIKATGINPVDASDIRGSLY